MRWFHIYAISLISLMTVGHWLGWGLSEADSLKGVPRSVRDNPGSYRSVYTHYTHYSGGK